MTVHASSVSPLRRRRYTASYRTDDGIAFAVCTDRSHGDGGYVWEPSQAGKTSQRSDGLGAELAIWDKLLVLLDPTEDFVPYGVVEDRLFERYPDDASTLLNRYGHKFRDAEHPSTQYSMSAYLASRLRELNQEGAVDLKWDKAVGPWAHNEVISHWRLAQTS